MTSSFRTERDSMGELTVPGEALWGAQTQRAVQNFPISGLPLPRAFIRALAVQGRRIMRLPENFQQLRVGNSARIHRRSSDAAFAWLRLENLGR